MTIASVLLAAHLLPGFEPWVLGRPERVSSDAPPYLLRLSWERLLAGCTLLAWWIGQPSRHGEKPMLAVPVYLTTLVAIPGFGLLLGVVARRASALADHQSARFAVRTGYLKRRLRAVEGFGRRAVRSGLPVMAPDSRA